MPLRLRFLAPAVWTVPLENSGSSFLMGTTLATARAPETLEGEGQSFPQGGGPGGGGAVGGTPPPSGDPELLEAPQAPKKIFGLN